MTKHLYNPKELAALQVLRREHYAPTDEEVMLREGIKFTGILDAGNDWEDGKCLMIGKVELCETLNNSPFNGKRIEIRVRVIYTILTR